MRLSQRRAALEQPIVESQASDQWEYLTANGPTPETLNRLGKEGWELICGYSDEYNHRLYFKRKLKL